MPISRKIRYILGFTLLISVFLAVNGRSRRKKPVLPKLPQNVTFKSGYHAYRGYLSTPLNTVYYPSFLANTTQEECSKIVDQQWRAKVVHSAGVRYLTSAIPAAKSSFNIVSAIMGEKDYSNKLIANLLLSIVEENAEEEVKPSILPSPDIALVISDAENLTEYDHRIILSKDITASGLRVTAFSAKSSLSTTIITMGFSNGTVSSWSLKSHWTTRTKRMLERKLFETGAQWLPLDNVDSAIDAGDSAASSKNIATTLHKYGLAHSRWFRESNTCRSSGITLSAPARIGFGFSNEHAQGKNKKDDLTQGDNRGEHVQNEGLVTLVTQDSMSLEDNTKDLVRQRHELEEAAASSNFFKAVAGTGSRSFFPQFELRWMWSFHADRQEDKAEAEIDSMSEDANFESFSPSEYRVASVDIYLTGKLFVVNAVILGKQVSSLFSISSSGIASQKVQWSLDVLKNPLTYYSAPVHLSLPEQGQQMFEGLPKGFISHLESKVSVSSSASALYDLDKDTMLMTSTKIGLVAFASPFSLWVLQVSPPAKSRVMHVCTMSEILKSSDYEKSTGRLVSLVADPSDPGVLHMLFTSGALVSVRVPARNPPMFTSEASRKQMCESAKITENIFRRNRDGKLPLNDEPMDNEQLRLVVFETYLVATGLFESSDNSKLAERRWLAINPKEHTHLGIYAIPSISKRMHSEVCGSLATFYPNPSAKSTIARSGISFLVADLCSEGVLRLNSANTKAISRDESSKKVLGRPAILLNEGDSSPFSFLSGGGVIHVVVILVWVLITYCMVQNRRPRERGGRAIGRGGGGGIGSRR